MHALFPAEEPLDRQPIFDPLASRVQPGSRETEMANGSKPQAGHIPRRGISPLLLATALGLAAWSGPAGTQTMDQIKIGHQVPPTFETVYRHLALDRGFFARQRLDVKITGFSAGLTAVQAVISGSVDFGCESIVSVLTAIRQGADLRILEMINADNSYVIVARDNIAAPADFRKKRWGVSQVGAISHTYSTMWLGHQGIKDNEVDWIPIGGQQARSRALLARQIDTTMLTFGDWVGIQNEPGIKLVAHLSDAVPPLPFSSCFATGRTAQGKPDIVQRFINGLMQSVRYARTPEGKAAYLAAHKAQNGTHLSDPQLDQFYDFFFKQNAFLVDPNGGMYPDVLYQNLRMLVADKTLEVMPALEKVWEPRFVQQYLGEHGWYDVRSGTAGHYLRDLVTRN
jgi:ABC-type nitrate/sulfonate/bicarbonate transport system substrate-binding protein